MFYHLLYPLHDEFIVFNVFRYITFRTFCAFLTALGIYFFYGEKWIAFLKAKQFGQVIRADGPASHLEKKNTPTMGGVLVVGSLMLSSLLWSDLTNPYLWVSLYVLVGFGAVGLIDDLKKITRKNTLGFRGQYKIVLEVAICLSAALFLYGNGYLDTKLRFPFFKDFQPDLGIWYLYFTILGTDDTISLPNGQPEFSVGRFVPRNRLY
jgi:phospho-N-acetylmuramoyl-pentapeptide-transferase